MLKKYRPITPGTRQLILSAHEALTRQEGKRQVVPPPKGSSASKKTHLRPQ